MSHKVRLIIVFIIGILIPTNLFASRIDELASEAKVLVDEVNDMNKKIQEKQIRLIEIQGAVKELTLKKEEGKKWEKVYGLLFF